MFPGELAARKDIVYYSHKVHAEGLVSATDGNLSVRLDENHVLITPSSLRKEDMFLEAPIVINMEGELVSGDRRPSTELKVHLEAYRQRPDIKALIHAHPPKAIAFTIAEEPLNTCMLPEVVVTMGDVPVAPYAAPSTEALPESMRELIRNSDTLMLARHGSVTVGKDLGDAFKKLEKLEHNAQIMIYARILGGPKPFSGAELEQLEGLRSFYGVKTQHIACAAPGSGGAAGASSGAIKSSGGDSSGSAGAGVDSSPRRVSVDRWNGVERDQNGEIQAPTYRRNGAAVDDSMDALVDEIVARVKERL